MDNDSVTRPHAQHNTPAAYLRPDNPRLSELLRRYGSLSIAPLKPSRWTRNYINTEVSLSNFRGDCAYVWQRRDGNEESHHLISAEYLLGIDTLHLFDLLHEDDSFGAQVYDYYGKYVISRDLLDSINEILFLERHLAISRTEGLNVLDIGAGYGRLAHRLVAAFPSLHNVLCVDAVPESTFISEFYLNYRGVSDKALVIPIDEIEEALKSVDVSLATNIHCFSECRLESINWWLDLLERNSVRYLMIEPNAGAFGGTKLLSFEGANNRIEYMKHVESRGYTLIAREPTYRHPDVQKTGVSPTYYYLFELMR